MCGSTPPSRPPTRPSTVPAITFDPTLSVACRPRAGRAFAVPALALRRSAAAQPGRAARAAAAAGSGCRPGAASPRRSASPPCDARGRSCRARRRCSGCRRCLRGRRTCRASRESPILRMTPSLTATTGAPCGGEDVDPAPCRRGGDHFGGVAVVRLAGARAPQRRAGGDVVGVAGVGGDREVGALGEPGQRADQVGREPAVGAGVEQHLLHVPVGVVVGEDRVVEVAWRRRRPSGSAPRRRSRRPGCRGPCARRRWRRARTLPSSTAGTASSRRRRRWRR